MLKYLLWVAILSGIITTVVAAAGFTKLLKENEGSMLGRMQEPLAKRLRVMSIGIVMTVASVILYFILG